MIEGIEDITMACLEGVTYLHNEKNKKRISKEDFEEYVMTII